MLRDDTKGRITYLDVGLNPQIKSYISTKVVLEHIFPKIVITKKFKNQNHLKKKIRSKF